MDYYEQQRQQAEAIRQADNLRNRQAADADAQRNKEANEAYQKRVNDARRAQYPNS